MFVASIAAALMAGLVTGVCRAHASAACVCCRRSHDAGGATHHRRTFAAAGPNLLVLLADDMGYGDVDFTGGVASTPNLRAMAQANSTVWFQRFYSGAPVCSPTRASILTGRTPSRDCIYNVEQQALSRNDSTIAASAAAAGYATGFFGKWHLGSLTNATTPDCYVGGGTPCLPGYVAPANNKSLCCDGRDAQLPVVTPLDVGFRVALATPQVSATSTANCGCLMTVPGAGVGCNLGHYNGTGPIPDVTHMECQQYLSGAGAGQPLQSYQASVVVMARAPASR